MGTESGAPFDDSGSVARHIGEAVGTHYSAALRAADTYAKCLARGRDSGDPNALAEESLGNFWLEMMRLEKVRQSTPDVIKGLRTEPSHYFTDFLDTAEEVFEECYKDVSEEKRKKLGHVQHQKCIELLRDHRAAGLKSHFEVKNQVASWMQMLRLMGGFRD